MLIATLGERGDLVSDVAPLLTSNTPITPVASVAQVYPTIYNSAIWWFRSTDSTPSYQRRSGYSVIIIFDSQPTSVTLNNADISSYVNYDSNSGLYYLYYSGSGNYNFITYVSNTNIPVFFENRTSQDPVSPSQECYDYVTTALITYHWTSVPAISGKNGILSLPVLIDTDGNPVSNGSASDFSTLPDSVKVRTLADLAVQ